MDFKWVLKTEVVLKEKKQTNSSPEKTRCSFFLPVNIKVLMTDTGD